MLSCVNSVWLTELREKSVFSSSYWLFSFCNREFLEVLRASCNFTFIYLSVQRVLHRLCSILECLPVSEHLVSYAFQLYLLLRALSIQSVSVLFESADCSLLIAPPPTAHTICMYFISWKCFAWDIFNNSGDKFECIKSFGDVHRTQLIWFDKPFFFFYFSSNLRKKMPKAL